MDEDFEPISSIHGNIEVSFNSKIKQLDPYEKVEDQLDEFVIAIGKTGRANRLTVKADELESEDLENLSEQISRIAEEIEKLEELRDYYKDGVDQELSDDAKEVLEQIPEDEPITIDNLVESCELQKNRLYPVLEELKTKGEVFEPSEDEVQSI